MLSIHLPTHSHFPVFLLQFPSACNGSQTGVLCQAALPRRSGRGTAETGQGNRPAESGNGRSLCCFGEPGFQTGISDAGNKAACSRIRRTFALAAPRLRVNRSLSPESGQRLQRYWAVQPSPALPLSRTHPLLRPLPPLRPSSRQPAKQPCRRLRSPGEMAPGCPLPTSLSGGFPGLWR